MYAKEINGQIETARSLKVLYPNTSFPKDVQEHDGWKRVVDNGAGDFQVKDVVVFIDGVPTQTYTDSVALKEAHLANYRDKKASTYTYRAVPMQLGVGARHDLSTLYLTALADSSILDSTVMAVWQEDGYSDLNITAKNLRDDGATIMGHYQKCWAVHSIVKARLSDYNTPAEIEGAFDAAYAA